MPVNRVVLIGATGSIGQQALDVIGRYPDSFQLVGAVAGRRAEALAAALAPFPGAQAVIVDPGDQPPVGMGVGVEAACRLAASEDADVVLIGGGGAGALLPTLAACRSGHAVAIATKEVLVMAGELVTGAARKHGATLIPVDSEHSAIWQCLRGEEPSTVSRLLLTASGGPFRLKPLSAVPSSTPKEALAHPNWNMGPKVTVDSATMMNKGLEVIEAHFLFNIPYERIEVVVHPQSVVHSAVQFCDGTLIAQLGVPDMRAPIALALNRGRRLPGVVSAVRLEKVARLDFEPMDLGRFPILAVVRQVALRGGCAPSTMNAANEVAVASFLEGKISFGDISSVVSTVVDGYSGSEAQTLATVLEADAWGRARASALVANLAAATA
ncbi:MAG TPA: 1-deoxy-D-xylulose-5-phosphate reductoisomerase [Candidatus Dormibacteraeota bacterium]|nr:1-deoxy-D-xylulose-5-phosphate reductoisomerase [Candidatus Dormibacteraeota bacterium]